MTSLCRHKEDLEVYIQLIQNLALEGMGGQYHALVTLPLGKRAGTHCTGDWVGGSHVQSGWMRKISSPPAVDPCTVQPLLSCYTAYSIPTHSCLMLQTI